MTQVLGGRGTIAVSVDQALRLVLDHSCGTCVTCEAGSPIWCPVPIGVGRALCAYPEHLGGVEVLASLMTLSALFAADLSPLDVALVITPGSSTGLVRLARLVHPGPVLSATDPRETSVRTVLAKLTLTGRADAVLSTHSARVAVRAVSRGGCVCLPDAVVDAATVTELVQRELRLVGPRNLHQVIEKVGRTSIEAALEAA